MMLWENLTARGTLRGKVLKFSVGCVSILVLLTAISGLALPLSSCVAPWGVQLDRDHATPNWIACVTDLARRTGHVSLCESLADKFIHDDCITAVATFQKDPNVCTTMEIFSAYNCLLNF